MRRTTRRAAVSGGLAIALVASVLMAVPAPPRAEAAEPIAATAANTTAFERLSLTPEDGQFTGDAVRPSLSADGRFAAFVAGLRVYVRDRLHGTTEAVSVAQVGTGAGGPASGFAPSISADGRYVAFSSSSPSLVPGDGNNLEDIFLADRVDGTIVRVGRRSSPSPFEERAELPSISGDGDWIAFVTEGLDWTGFDWRSKVYLVRRTAPTSAEAVSRVTGRDEGAAHPAVNGDGSRIAYLALIDGHWVLCLRDRATGTTRELATVAPASLAPFGAFPLAPPSISPDGQTIAYVSYSDDLRHSRLEVWQAGVGSTVLHEADATADSQKIEWPSLSADGQRVVFTLVDGVFNAAMINSGQGQVYVHDRATGASTLVTADAGGEPLDGDVRYTTISGDGSLAAFSTTGALEESDTNGVRDVYAAALAPADTTDPTWPDGAALTAEDIGARVLRLRWPAASDGVGVSGYLVTADGALLAQTAQTEFAVSGLAPETTYEMAVTPRDAAGNTGPALTLSVTTLAQPAEGDAALIATAEPGGLVGLQWDAATEATDGYRIERATDDGPFEAVTDTTSTTHTDTGLRSQTTYRYRVLAVDTAGTAHAHTAEASATTPALAIDAVEWSAPRLPRTGELRLGSDLTVTVRAEPNREASADIDYTTWLGEGGAQLEEPAAGSLTLALEEGQPGVYSGVVPIMDATASITALEARLSDGVVEHDATASASGLPVAVSGLVVAQVDAPAGSLAGGRILVWSDEAHAGAQQSLGGGGDVEFAVSPADYVLRILRSDGGLAAEVDAGQVAAGQRITLDVVPELAATLAVDVVAADGAPVGNVEVKVTDDRDGRLVSASRTNAQGSTPQLSGLTWRTTLRVTATVDPLRYTSAETTVVLDAGANEATVVLTRRPRGVVEGSVADHAGEPVEGAVVQVLQSFGGVAANSAATTDAEGRYHVDAYAGSADVRASHRRGTPPAGLIVEVPADGAVTADVQLREPVDYAVTLAVYTRFAGSQWQGPLPIDWRTSVHLGLRLHTPSARTPMSETTLVRAEPGQNIEACANGREAGLPAVCQEIVLGADKDVTVELRLEQTGLVRAHLTNAAGADHRSTYTAVLSRVEADGSHRLVSRRVASGALLEMAVDEPGEHEILVTAAGVSSAPTRVTVPQAGIGDAGRLTLAPRGQFQGEGNSLEALRPVVLPGDTVEWRTAYRYGGTTELAAAVALLPIPAGSEVLPAGTLLDGEPASATVAGGFLEVALGDLAPGDAGVVRHRVRLVDDALAAVGGSAFIRAGGVGPWLVGTSSAAVAAVSLEAPQQSTTRRIAVSGRAPAGRDVEVLEGDLVLARTASTAGGYWHAEIALADLGRGHEHTISARTVVDGAVLHSRPAFVTVDDTLPVITEIAMAQPDGRRVVFNPANGVARFPYVWVPGRPMVVDVSFSDPDRVEDVEVRIGDRRAAAERRADGAYRASVASSGRGDVFIDYQTLGLPLDLNDPGDQVPTVEQFRNRSPLALSSFTDVTVTESPGSNRSLVTAKLPGIGPDVSLSADLSMAWGQLYTPTDEDLAAERASGAPVYGLSWEASEGAGGLSVELSAYIPEHALGPGASSAEAVTLLNQAMTASTVSFAQAGASFVQAAAPAVRLSLEWAFTRVTNFDDLLGGMENASIFEKLSSLLDRLDGCPPDVVSAYTNRLQNLARQALIVQVTQWVVMAAGVVVGPATFGLGTLAIWAATTAVAKGMDYAIERSYDKIRREIAALDCSWADDGDKYAEPVWIHDPSGFVYEAVESNRVEGVTTAVMQAPTADGPWTLWDAAWFGQDNPQVTGADGRYGWDVPEGWWMVAYMKDGYVTAYSEALEVLPPHFDVNEGLVPVAAPSVAGVDAVAGATSGVHVAFDQYMRVQVVEAVGIEVLDDGGDPVAGSLAAVSPSQSPTGEALARWFAFTPDAPLEAGAELTVAVPEVAQNHAGRTMAAEFSTTVTVAAVDGAPPETSATVSPSANSAGWHRDSVTVELSAVDGGAGIAEVAWTLDGAQTGEGSAPGDRAGVVVSAEGQTTVSFWAVDLAGNVEEPSQITVRIDRTPPTVSCAATPAMLWPPNHRLVDVAVSVDVADALSGPAATVLRDAASSDPDNAPGDADGNTIGDVRGFDVGTADLAGQLRAERVEGQPRVYALRYEVYDVAGNSTACSTLVIVPADRSGRAR